MTKHLPDLHHVDELKNFAANNLFRLVIEVVYWDPRNCQPLSLDLLLGNRIVLKMLMFVTIVVLQVTLILIVSNCFLISECPIGLILCLKVLYLFLVSY